MDNKHEKKERVIRIGQWTYDKLRVIISTFVGQNVGQTVGYGIGIAAKFVLQLSKLNSNQYRSSITEINGPGGI